MVSWMPQATLTIMGYLRFSNVVLPSMLLAEPTDEKKLGILSMETLPLSIMMESAAKVRRSESGTLVSLTSAGLSSMSMSRVPGAMFLTMLSKNSRCFSGVRRAMVAR